MSGNQILRKLSRTARRASPTILTCLSAVGTVATAVVAVKATPKALSILEEARKTDLQQAELTAVECVHLTWRCYIPAAIVGASTIACVFGGNILSRRNQASLASAYALLHQSYQRYRAAANAVFGDDADSRIKMQMAKDSYVSADGYTTYSLDADTEGERSLCFDVFSNRYFTTTMAAVLNAEYHLNRNLALRGQASINEFYSFLGIDGLSEGDEMGWDLTEMVEGGLQWLDFENRLTTMDDGALECYVISALWEPCILDT